MDLLNGLALIPMNQITPWVQNSSVWFLIYGSRHVPARGKISFNTFH